MIAPFAERYRRALADPRLRSNLLSFQRAWRLTRDAAFERLTGETETSFAGSKAQLVAAKDGVLADPGAARARFVRAFTARGGIVHDATTADDARAIVLRLLQEREVTLFAKGKSMVAEEVFLNHHLEAAGIRVVETDLGEWIIQLAHETPSHMVMPAIHKSREQVATLFEAETHRPVDPDDIGEMVRLARTELRRVFLNAGAGMIGANALIADTGTVMLVTNEGNGDLVSTLPKTLIVITSFSQPAITMRVFGRVLTRSPLPSFVTSITVPVSAMSAFAPIIPAPAFKNTRRSSARARRTIPPMSSGSTVRCVSASKSVATCWRLLWIAGMTMWLGVSWASWMIHSPRSVSTTRIPAASRWWLRNTSSATIDFPFAKRVTSRSWRSRSTIARASSAVDASCTTPPRAVNALTNRARAVRGSASTPSFAATSCALDLANDVPVSPASLANAASRVSRQARWNESRLPRRRGSASARRYRSPNGAIIRQAPRAARAARARRP